MGFKNKVVTRDKVSGYFVPTDVQDGEHNVNELKKRLAAQQEAVNEGITADWSTPGDDSPSLGNSVSQLRKSIEKYGSDDNGKRGKN